MLSIPPATITSCDPHISAWDAIMTDFIPDAHTCVDINEIETNMAMCYGCVVEVMKTEKRKS